MGNCRRTQNIFFYLKRKDFKSAWIFIKNFDKLSFEDSFMPIVCKIIGHKKYTPDKYCPDEIACKRCHRFL